ISESMTSEIRGIMYLLSSKHILEFEVGGIFINGQMEAFIIASRLKHSTIQIHVEKANKEIRGLYPAILKEMLEHHYPDEQYVNREEDMGLENLRKSKLSLHPIKMIQKYRISLKNIQIVSAEDNDLDDIKKLWLSNFSDETIQSTEFYFNNIYHKEYTYLLKNNSSIISVAQILPMTINKNHQKEVIYFILGVCTKKTFENQGYMRLLLEYILDKYKQKTVYLQAYVPDIYRKFGFCASHYHQVVVIDKEHLIVCGIETSPIDLSLLSEYYHNFTNNFDDYRVRDDDFWNLLLKRCEAFDDHILLFKNYGYLIYHEDEEQIYISEFIYLNKSAAISILSFFKNIQKQVVIECDLNIHITGDRRDIITMMSNQLSEDKYDVHKFINEIY
ncbi:MAG: GNAT family N-acetyltransferase, partial [Coprobacillus sp.]